MINELIYNNQLNQRNNTMVKLVIDQRRMALNFQNHSEIENST